MITVSLCMIVKNEEAVLARCLESACPVADEIVVVDTGSGDSTREVARRYTDLIYDFVWCDDFSAARNFSYEKARMDYILWLDADDVILPEDQKKFIELKQTLDPATDFVMMRYNTGFDAQGRVTFSYYRERLSRRAGGYWWSEPVHECMTLSGKIVTSDICITHLRPPRGPSRRNLDIYERLLEKGEKLSPRGQYYYARELKDHQKYEKAARQFESFLDSGKGWVEDNIAACGELARCLAVLGDGKGALRALIRSFEYDLPRPEICCQMGYYYKSLGDFARAAYWFEQAVITRDEKGWGFQSAEHRGYIPFIELAVCMSMLGEIGKAEQYNEIAGYFKPNDPAVAYNRQYFADLKGGRAAGGEKPTGI